ncbi:DEAD/DEAH box helicase [Geopsychrobacter electrodiphilus]|uniref:DEAD/DEAH box helicase n=1 Tax=Geopsychrobacter electrodiphilus TaxID=225196 RepID=UPI00037C75CA|nr:DEAD/DEAH box helicase [Geopsychrobacter electrodiphilus]
MTESQPLGFADLGLAPNVFKVIKELGYESPSEIQAQSIPPLLAGRDLLGQAQTGTGKTAAFALPLLSMLDLKKRVPQILVLAPTRELALQVSEAIQTYARHLKDFHVLPIYGGQSMVQQLRQLSRGVHAIVGTPGRIQDHLRRGTLKLDNIRTVVVDEADEMLKMGFIADVEDILSHAPAERQTALFSATMPSEVNGVARRNLRNPVEIRIQTKTRTAETIDQYVWQVKGMHKLDALTRILEVEETEAMIVFVRTKVATVELAEKLEARGFSCAALNGDMTQQAREKTVERFRDGKLDIVVATDVAARGLDVQRISHVINYDIPNDIEAYIHRIGRTGRAGRAGKAILFAAPREQRMIAAIERATRQKIKPMGLPSRQQVTDRRVSQFKELVTEAMEAQDLEFFEDLIDGYQNESDVSFRRIAATLAFLLQKERPLQPEERVESLPPQREPRESTHSSSSQQNYDIERLQYRVEVGRTHGVEPGNLVGALSNEGNMPSSMIGKIKIMQEFSLVDLPKSLSPEVLAKLAKVWVRGQQLQISLDGGQKQAPKRRTFGKPASGFKKPVNRRK